AISWASYPPACARRALLRPSERATSCCRKRRTAMNWISNYVRPRINSMLGRRDMPENLWIKDPETGEMVFHKDLEENMYVVPSSGHHLRITGKERLKHFFDGGSYDTFENPKVVTDPLRFRDEKRYIDRLKDAKAKTSMEDAIIGARGEI